MEKNASQVKICVQQNAMHLCFHKLKYIPLQYYLYYSQRMAAHRYLLWAIIIIKRSVFHESFLHPPCHGNFCKLLAMPRASQEAKDLKMKCGAKKLYNWPRSSLDNRSNKVKVKMTEIFQESHRTFDLPVCRTRPQKLTITKKKLLFYRRMSYYELWVFLL